MDYTILFTFVLASAALAISPGPDNIYVLVQSLTNGKASGMATVCGLIAGCIIHTTLLAFGVSAIIRANDNLFFGIKILGALYLLYLAYKVYRSKSKIDFESNTVKRSSFKSLFFQGFLMNVFNPKVTIFFLAFFPGFLFSETFSHVIQFYILGGLFMLVSFIIFTIIVLLASKIRSVLNYKHSEVFFRWLQIIVFIGIAIFILN